MNANLHIAADAHYEIRFQSLFNEGRALSFPCDAEGHVPLIPKAEYTYSPRRPPELRSDPTGRSDKLPELLATATQRKLTETEAAAKRPTWSLFKIG